MPRRIDGVALCIVMCREGKSAKGRAAAGNEPFAKLSLTCQTVSRLGFY